MQYRSDNTEGYSAYDLVQLNRIYKHRIALLGEDERENADLLQHTEAEILYDYDQARDLAVNDEGISRVRPDGTLESIRIYQVRPRRA